MRIIDLSAPIYSGMETYPGDPEVRIEKFHDYKDKSWLLTKITLGSHTGTHVDACSHMDEEGKNLDDIPLGSFYGKACIVDETLPLPVNTGLIFRQEADIRWLESIVSAGPTFVGGGITETLQRMLLKKGIITYTNLVNLEQLPVNQPFLFIGFPLKIKKGDGSPVRAVAILD